MTQKQLLLAVAATLIASLSTWAQTGASVVNLGYQTARTIVVAPGQVLNLTLHGLTTSFDATQVANAFPLPTNFNGLSVSLQQSGATTPILMPLLNGSGVLSCNRGLAAFLIQPANLVTCPFEDATFDLVVQIPFELKPNLPGIDNGCTTVPCQSSINDAVLTITEAAGTGASLRVFPVVDQIHILNSCTDNVSTVLLAGPSVYATYACYPLITHADSTGVSPSKPAKPGEELIAWAFGLGRPDTAFTTVSGTPAAGVPVSRPFTLSFTGVTAPGYSSPDYVGLVGGEAGL